MIPLTNKVSIITGAAGGLGKALAMELYKQGCHLALIDIDLPGLEKLKSEFENGKQTISIHKADVSKEEEIISARKEILQIHNRADLLINNAGVSISLPFEELSVEDFKWLFDINFWGMVYCTKHFLADLKKQNQSRLANIISDFALMGFPGKTAYASSKSAIMGFTNSLKTELHDTSVMVSLVIPPPLDTGLVINSKHIDDEKRMKEAGFLKKKGMPLDKTARRIIKQIRKGKYRIVVGRMMFFIDLISRLFPSMVHRMIAKNKKKFPFT